MRDNDIDGMVNDWWKYLLETNTVQGFDWIERYPSSTTAVKGIKRHP